MQGTTRSGCIHATDWYATFLTLAGLSAAEIANDARAAAAHLPAIDSINMLSFLFRTLTARLLPRALGPRSRSTAPSKGECALIVGDFKLLQGPVISATWSGQLSPNKNAGPMAAVFKRYTAQCSSGCLLKFSAPADSQRADALRFRRAGKGNGSAGHPNASKRRAELSGVARGAYSTEDGAPLAAPGFLSWDTLVGDRLSNLQRRHDPFELRHSHERCIEVLTGNHCTFRLQ